MATSWSGPVLASVVQIRAGAVPHPRVEVRKLLCRVGKEGLAAQHEKLL